MLGTAGMIFTAAAAAISAGGNHEGDIQSYEKRLDAFNAVYGANIEISDDEYAREFYEAMSFVEFDNYIMSVYDGSAYNPEKPSIYGGVVDGTIIEEFGVAPSAEENGFTDL